MDGANAASSLQVDAGAIANSCADPRQIPVQVDAARTEAIRMAPPATAS
jgi:hypothetical protein